jgi:hypothetical protein
MKVMLELTMEQAKHVTMLLNEDIDFGIGGQGKAMSRRILNRVWAARDRATASSKVVKEALKQD